MDSLENDKDDSKIHLESNLKRLKSLKNLKKAYQNQKSIIKNALSNIDKVDNRIRFDEDGEQTQETHNRGTHGESKRNKTLFENDSDDDNFEADFSVKQQFEGEEGQKLLALQAKYKHDKRFNLDERFLNDDEDDQMENGFTEKKDYNTVSMEDNDEEMSLEKEKEKQLQILDQILEKKNLKTKVKSKPTIVNKLMVRFDPAQPDHSKYEEKEKKETDQTVKKKKEKKKMTTQLLEEKKTEETVIPEVSKDIFYQVKGNLKESLTENKQVSLLSMFGQNIEENGVEEAEEQNKVETIQPRFTKEINPFKYDSSDDDEEMDVSNIDSIQKTKDHTDIGKTSNRGPNFWVETFFFKDDDYRLQEGFEFIEKMKMEDQTDFTKSRRQLKEIVKIKYRNVQQKNKPFKRKLGGSKRRKKDIRIKKALKK